VLIAPVCDLATVKIMRCMQIFSRATQDCAPLVLIKPDTQGVYCFANWYLFPAFNLSVIRIGILPKSINGIRI